MNIHKNELHENHKNVIIFLARFFYPIIYKITQRFLPTFQGYFEITLISAFPASSTVPGATRLHTAFL